MAKLKIAGYPELIEIKEGEAKEVRKLWDDKNIPNNHKIIVRNISVTKGDIKGIFLRAEEDSISNIYKDRHREYYEARDALLRLSLKERAEKTSWGPFLLFYFGVYGKRPEENMKDELFRVVTSFYEQNPKWSKPSIKCFYEFLKIPQSAQIDSKVFRILERIEDRELVDIKEVAVYEKESETIEKKSDKIKVDYPVIDLGDEEITAEDLPF